MAASLPGDVILSPLSLSCFPTFKIMLWVCVWEKIFHILLDKCGLKQMLWSSGELFKDNYLSCPSSQSWTVLDPIRATPART